MHLLFDFGYLSVFLLIALESVGIPVPGETTLITAAILASTTHKLNIYLILLVAILGAIVGDNIGYWIGRELGGKLIEKYGKKIGLTEKKVGTGQYLFIKHGGKIVFFGRFIALLRVLAAFLSGINKMPWRQFLLFNAAGATTWATLYGVGTYVLGKGIHKLDAPVKITTAAIAITVIIGVSISIKKYERKLEEEAEQYFKSSQKSGLRKIS